MQLEPFDALNELESGLMEAKCGALPMGELVTLLLDATIYVSSKKEVQEDGAGFEPLLLQQAGSPLVAAFTDITRAALHRGVAEYVLSMTGRDLVLRLPDTFGLIFNPGYIAQLIFSPPGIADIKRNLKKS